MNQESRNISKDQMLSAMEDHGAELVDLYLKTTEREIGKLQRAISSGDKTVALRLAHSATGASAVMGFSTMADHLRKLEVLIGENKLTTASTYIGTLSKALEDLRDAKTD